jgi:phage-related protein
METVIPRIVSGVELLANSLGGLIGYFRFVIQDGDYLNDFLTHLPDSIQPIVKSIGELISGFQSGVTGEFATNLSDMGVVMFRVGQIVNDVLTGGFQQLFTTFEDGSSRLSALFSALGMGEDAAQQLASTINSILGPVIQWVSKNVELKDVLIATGIAIASVVIPALASIVAAAAPIIATGAALIAAVTLVRKAWSSNWLGIRDKTQVIVDFIRDFIQKAIESIRSFWENNGQKILSSTRKIFSAISDFIKTVIKTIRIFWENNGEALTTAAQNTWNMIKKVVSVAIDVIKNFIQAWVASLQGDWDGFSTHLQAVWEGLWTIVSTIVKTAVQNIRTTFSSVDWGNVGRAIIKGIANGIKNGAQAVINAAKAAARAALEAAKGILGIDSPSKAFAQVGRNASQGFAVGMEDTRPIEAAAEQLGRAALQATERSTSVQRIEAPVTVNAQVGDGLDLEDLAWRVSEIIGRRSMEYAV